MLYPPLAYDSSNHCRDIEGNIIEFIPKNKKQHNSKVYFEAVMDWKGRWYEDGELQDATFLQFTGLKDKNGREIYEGDIISGKFDMGPGGFITHESPVEYNLENGYQWNYWDLNTVEIIGNIFENPNLCKTEK